ncbi:MAG TPA: adenylate/guanylate cyclase domain-containing protein [Candidatus Acidoferrum sp.]|jgi:adenylate cyclase|nr:adenylate/guanylate cyclase domain-containing protein [Candidatus Acidoferrum sp.]
MASRARTARRPALLIALGIIGLIGGIWYIAPEFLHTIEFNLYDQHFRLRGRRPPNPQVAIVTIDDASLATVGRWPWSRVILAQLVRRLDEAGAASIAFDVLLNEPERSPEREIVERLRKRLGGGGLSPGLRAELERIVAEADPDAALAAAMRDSGRVVLASHFLFGVGLGTAPPERTGPPMKSAIGVRLATDPPPSSRAPAFTNYTERGVFPPLHAREETFPIPPLAAAAAAIGHVNMIPERDGSTRYEALIVESRGYYYPSLAVEAVRVAAGLDPSTRTVAFGESITLRLPDEGIVIPTDARSRVLIDYAGPDGTIPHVAAAEVLQGKGLERVKDRAVFIGATAPGLVDVRVTPFSAILPGVEKHANVAANILDRRFIVRPWWFEYVEAAGIVLFPLLLAIVLPALRPYASIAVTLALWAGLFAAGHYAFRRGQWINLVYPSLALLLTFIAITVYRFFTEERQRQYTRRAFQQYVSPEVVERIMQNPEALQFGGELRNLTVLFSDIRDFTTFTEKNDPQMVVQMLREYLTEMTRIVIEEGGTLDKYIGDAVMAEFGAPIAYPDHALRGCRAALRMAAEVERLTAKWTAEGKEPFRIGLGVNTGNMVVGNLGSEQLFDYTVIGDEVNLGARLESLNKDYQTDKHIIISEGTYEATGEAIEVRRLGEVKVKGKTRPVVVYELLALTSTPTSTVPA